MPPTLVANFSPERPNKSCPKKATLIKIAMPRAPVPAICNFLCLRQPRNKATILVGNIIQSIKVWNNVSSKNTDVEMIGNNVINTGVMRQ